MDKDIFERRVKALWPTIVIHKTVSISPDNHLSVVSVGADGVPFFVGLRHGIPAVFDMRMVNAAHQRYSEIVCHLGGIMELMSALLASRTPRDHTAFNELLDIKATDQTS